MSDLIGVYMDIENEARLVGRCRFITKRPHATSEFRYDPSWLNYQSSFALDPENLPLTDEPFYTRMDTSCLPGAIRDSAPDRWHTENCDFRQRG